MYGKDGSSVDEVILTALITTLIAANTLLVTASYNAAIAAAVVPIKDALTALTARVSTLETEVTTLGD